MKWSEEARMEMTGYYNASFGTFGVRDVASYIGRETEDLLDDEPLVGCGQSYKVTIIIEKV